MAKIIEVSEEKYNTASVPDAHIVQSSGWGVFKQKQNASKIFYFFDIDTHDLLISKWMMYTTTIPLFGTIGVITQCYAPTKELIEILKTVAEREHLFYIKLEPLIESDDMKSLGLHKGTDLFLKNTFILDLNQFFSESDILPSFSTSTRRNIRIAQKKGVKVTAIPYAPENINALDRFYSIQEATMKRHEYASHALPYFHLLYDTLKEVIVFEASYNDEVIGSMITVLHDGVMYYPYGASKHEFIETKAINLLIYESILYAYKAHAHAFNFWGALPANPSQHDPLYGVHMFKKGYNGVLHEYVGAYDLIIQYKKYYIFEFAYKGYWWIRKTARALKRLFRK